MQWPLLFSLTKNNSHIMKIFQTFTLWEKFSFSDCWKTSFLKINCILNHRLTLDSIFSNKSIEIGKIHPKIYKCKGPFTPSAFQRVFKIHWKHIEGFFHCFQFALYTPDDCSVLQSKEKHLHVTTFKHSKIWSKWKEELERKNMSKSQ